MLVLLATTAAVLSFQGIGGADTTGTPDPNTRADWSPATVDATHGNVAPATLTGATEGRVVNVHVDENAKPGTFFGVNAARLCRGGVSFSFSSQMDPGDFGDCIAHPFVTNQDDDFVQAPADSAHTSVDFTFRVGTGTQTFQKNDGSSSTITCDATHACALWLDESVDSSINVNNEVLKHYDIQYASSGTTTSTSPSSSTSTTSPTGSSSTSTTSPTGSSSTSTTSPTGSSTTSTTTHSATTSTTTHATTSTSPSNSTSTTSPAGSSTTSTTTHSTSSTSTSSSLPSASSTTSTTNPGGPTTTSGQTTSTEQTTTTTAPSGVSVSPSSVAPGGTINVSSTGWMPCPTGSTSTSSSSSSTSSTSSSTCPPVSASIHSDPIALGTLTPDASGAAAGTFTVPADAPAGDHSLVLSGTGADGAPRTVQTPLTITSAGSAAGAGAASAGAAPAAAGSSAGGSSGGTLAATGGRVKALVWFGVLAIATGASLVKTARRRRARAWS